MKRIALYGLMIVLAGVAGWGVYAFFTEKPMTEAEGSLYNITILADPAESTTLKKAADLYLQKNICTPQTEAVFKLFFADSEFFLNGLKRRNIVVLCDLKRDGFTQRVTRQLLPPAQIEKAQKDGMNLVIARDYQAKDQIVAFFVGDGETFLEAAMELYGSRIADMVDSAATAELAMTMFEPKGRDKEIALEKQIEKDYNFHISIPKKFWQDKGTPADNFLWLRRLGPEQWVFVARVPVSLMDSFTLLSFPAVRDSICRLYYDGDVVDSIVSIEKGYNLGGLNAVRVAGLWRNDSTVLGGPFITYIADDKAAGYRYYIDAAVFAAGVRKEPFLRQVDAMALSFRPIRNTP